MPSATRTSRRIAVVGAGISGMSTAWMLRETGAAIDLYAEAFTPHLTSNRAAAFWFPYHVRNDARALPWCRFSYAYYEALAKDPASGISLKRLVKAVPEGISDEDSWIPYLPQQAVRSMPEAERPPGYAEAYEARVPVMETQIFLPYLLHRLQAAGVNIIPRRVEQLAPLQQQYSLVVNCTALGARTLVPDPQMKPVRGQVVLLEPGLPDYIFLDNHRPAYVVPRKDATIVGGTYEPGEESAHTVEATLRGVLEKACEIMPALRGRKIIGHWAGLRPYRPQVRLEQEAGTNLIHNYGHGGSGFTLSFGCARAVAELASAYL